MNRSGDDFIPFGKAVAIVAAIVLVVGAAVIGSIYFFGIRAIRPVAPAFAEMPRSIDDLSAIEVYELVMNQLTPAHSGRAAFDVDFELALDTIRFSEAYEELEASGNWRTIITGSQALTAMTIAAGEYAIKIYLESIGNDIRFEQVTGDLRLSSHSPNYYEWRFFLPTLAKLFAEKHLLVADADEYYYDEDIDDLISGEIEVTDYETIVRIETSEVVNDFDVIHHTTITLDENNVLTSILFVEQVIEHIEEYTFGNRTTIKFNFNAIGEDVVVELPRVLA